MLRQWGLKGHVIGIASPLPQHGVSLLKMGLVEWKYVWTTFVSILKKMVAINNRKP